MTAGTLARAEPEALPGRGRALHLDLFKTLLVAGMISAHVVQLITENPGRGALIWSEAVNLVAFSGFLLAFGLGVGLSVLRSPQSQSQSQSRPPGPALARRLRPALAVLLAVYASSFGYLLLAEREPLTARLAWDVLSTRRLFGWSEFLTSFLVLYLVLAVGRPALVAVAVRPRWLLAASVACLAGTMMTTRALWPLLGGLIGHEAYPNFPLLPYLPWFLVGIHLGARGRGIEGPDLALGLAATGAFGLFLWRNGWAPDRFPPSVLWIIGPALLLAFCLWLAERLAQRAPVPEVSLAAGRHVLISLVLSNLAIFTIRHLCGWPIQGGWAVLAMTVALVAAVTLWGALLDHLSRRVI